ncbi:hypothetical protein OEV98_10965 [Caldibacillus lycopersici]|uniref:Uncharacterized protein n=1 Tax=Perspicuibacillus lycopersici TaxID=1325689 RepID=A0AAE3LMZ1_9BACI|nr:hypothetical protein [Perspicuibacillus lycopersici]MCU9614080.1 hypothetical protein [Perspicuibacillus lycopersici]
MGYTNDGNQIIRIDNNKALKEKIEILTTQQNKKSVVLEHGVSVIDADVNGPLDLEIYGRTLVSLGNSILEQTKKFVLGQRGYKVKFIDGTLYSEVTKFQPPSLNTVANFIGKVLGSTIENPHILKNRGSSTTLITPTDTSAVEYGYGAIQSIDGTTIEASGNVNGAIAQQLISFNIIAEIERKIGTVPKSTTLEKIQWVQDNVERIILSWYGFGSSPNGNKANLKSFRVDNNSWHNYTPSHTNSNTTRLGYPIVNSDLRLFISTDGFINFLAYAEPSDGTTPSAINTDYVELQIELKPTCEFYRPSIIRVANFEGKQRLSTIENPHMAKNAPSGTTELSTPSSTALIEQDGTGYKQISSPDSQYLTVQRTGVGDIAQTVFSFNIIEEIERQIGKIPKVTLVEKIQWAKENTARVTCIWDGYGRSAGGFKATLAAYNFDYSSWDGLIQHTNSSVYTLSRGLNISSISRVDSNGFVHFIAYAEPSDGVTPSTIYTDYVELEIELKPNDDLYHPKVPLYEVLDDEYTKILVEWDENEVIKRYPSVQGMQHLQNPYVMVEGENLIPPFTDSRWSVHGNAKLISPYEIELNPTSLYNVSLLKLPMIKNRTYYFDKGDTTEGSQFRIEIKDSSGNNLLVIGSSSYFTVPSNAYEMLMKFQNNISGQSFIGRNPMLTIGDQPKPFVPYNPSYLYATTKLGQIGAYKDVLFKEDGKWKVQKYIEKNNELDGTLEWYLNVDYNGFKRFAVSNYSSASSNNSKSRVIDYKGRSLIMNPNVDAVDSFYLQTSNGYLYVTALDSETGFPESGYSPSTSDIQRYFNGWKYVDGQTWQSVTGNGQTATAQQALVTKPTDYVPYKLSYVLANPVVEEVQVEGDLTVNGLTQVEVGSGVVVREKVTPVLYSGNYFINEKNLAQSMLKNRLMKFLKVFKGQVDDTPNWTFGPTNANGAEKGTLVESKFDSTAEYTVTYLVLDRDSFTVNATEVKAFYDSSLKSVIDSLVVEQADTKTEQTILSKQIYDMLVRLKALEG